MFTFATTWSWLFVPPSSSDAGYSSDRKRIGESFCDRSNSAGGSSQLVTKSKPPTLYVFHAASTAKLNVIEQLGAELIGYDVDVAVITETHLKKR